jgi:hypothetical protein
MKFGMEMDHNMLKNYSCNIVYKSTVTNMVTVRNMYLISDKFNIDKFFSKIIIIIIIICRYRQ